MGSALKPVCMALLLLGSAGAETIFVDFGSDADPVTAPECYNLIDSDLQLTDLNRTWPNLTNAAGTQTAVSLNIAVTRDDGGTTKAGFSTPVHDPIDGIDPALTGDAMWLNQKGEGAGISFGYTLTFSGLSATHHTLRLIPAACGIFTSCQITTGTGNTAVISIPPNTSSAIPTWTQVIPESGIISVRCSGISANQWETLRVCGALIESAGSTVTPPPPQPAPVADTNAWFAYVRNCGLSGFYNEDTDLDGETDLYEFALAGDPTNQGIRAQRPVLSDTQDGFVTCTFPQLSATDSGVIYAAAWTDDLSTGAWSSRWDQATNYPSTSPDYTVAGMQLGNITNNCLFARVKAKPAYPMTTVCNPMDLSYAFRFGTPSRREAADPTVVLFKGTYYLFASKSQGYWYSDDLKEWTFIENYEIPTEEYAPTAVVMGDTLYFIASSNTKSTIYKSSNPKSGQWTVAQDELDQPVWDPALFLDEDGRLYLYWGCSNRDPIYGVELNTNTLSFIGSPVGLLRGHPDIYGWDARGDYNTDTDAPWIEGAWMNKYNGTYYLQYAGPGTQFKSYADGVYTSAGPLGPFSPALHNPFAYKPEGFACGAGHGSTFQDKIGNWWHVGTITISVKHHFERRLGFFPACFDADGVLYADTAYGDYPKLVPDWRISAPEEIYLGWMLLSYEKPVEVSSSETNHPPQHMCDEEIRTYWTASSGSDREWALMDLEQICDVYALQVNFAEHNTSLYGRENGIRHRYAVEASIDKIHWQTIIDKSASTDDRSHDYTQLDRKVACRYIRINNIEVPDGNFALCGLRVFGKGSGPKPAVVKNLQAVRDGEDRRAVTLSWDPDPLATGYLIRYGTAPEKRYLSYMVYNHNTVTIHSLNSTHGYEFTIEAFNENGITESGPAVTID